VSTIYFLLVGGENELFVGRVLVLLNGIGTA